MNLILDVYPATDATSHQYAKQSRVAGSNNVTPAAYIIYPVLTPSPVAPNPPSASSTQYVHRQKQLQAELDYL